MVAEGMGRNGRLFMHVISQNTIVVRKVCWTLPLTLQREIDYVKDRRNVFAVPSSLHVDASS